MLGTLHSLTAYDLFVGIVVRWWYPTMKDLYPTFYKLLKKFVGTKRYEPRIMHIRLSGNVVKLLLPESVLHVRFANRLLQIDANRRIEKLIVQNWRAEVVWYISILKNCSVERNITIYWKRSYLNNILQKNPWMKITYAE